MVTSQTQSTALKRLDNGLVNAIALWAASTTRPETWARDEKVQDKISALRAFFAFAGKHPGAVTPADVEAWRAAMEGQGLKPNTVYSRLSRLSSFYRWLLANPQLADKVQFNPVVQARPRCPRPYQSESVKAWTDKETAAILGVVKSLADSGSVVGKRDYALLLFYIYTGLRRNEGIGLRGRDLEYKEGRLIITYRRKGGKYVGREVSEPEVYEALKDYLEAADRINVLKTNGALWTRHDRARKSILPLGSRAFANNLKKYARTEIGRASCRE